MIDFTRINNDTHGNPRYVCHFLTFIDPATAEKMHEENGLTALDRMYDLALSHSRQFGGRKFHNKQYGGGIVFQSYNIDALGEEIEAFMSNI